MQRLLTIDASLVGFASDWAEGFSAMSAGNGEPSAGHGDIVDPVLARVIALGLGHVEGAGLADRCLELHDEIASLVRTIDRLEFESRLVAPLTAASADLAARQQEPRHWGAGTCCVCDRFVPGVADDRLRSGFCRKCFDAWRYALRTNPVTAPPLDRQQWIRLMRESLRSPLPVEIEVAGDLT